MRILATFSGLLLAIYVFAQAGPADSVMIEQRRVALENFNAFKSMLPDSSPVTLRALVLKADSLMQLDNQLITSSLPALNVKIDTLNSQLAVMKTKADEAKTLSETIEKYKIPALAGVGLLAFLMLLFMFLYFGKSSSSKKKIKKLQKEINASTEAQVKLNETETELLSLKEDMARLTEKHEKEIAQLKSDQEKSLHSLNDKNSSLEQSLKELRSELELKSAELSEIATLEQRLSDAESKADQLATARSEQEVLRSKEVSELNELRLKLAAAEQQISQSSDQNTRIETLQNELQKAKRENNELILLRLEYEKIKSNQSSNNDLYIDQLRDKDLVIEGMQKEMQQLKSDFNQLKDSANSSSNDKQAYEDLLADMKELKDENLRLESRLLDIEKESRYEYERLKSDYDRLVSQLKDERELRIEAERRSSETANGPLISDSEDLIRLRKELEEEKAFRAEVEKILEQLLKK